MTRELGTPRSTRVLVVRVAFISGTLAFLFAFLAAFTVALVLR